LSPASRPSRGCWAKSLPAGLIGCALAAALLACTSDADRLAQHLQRAETYAEQGQLSEALIEYRSALKLDPQNAQVNYQIGKLRFAQGEIADALFFYREARRLDPNLSAAALDEAFLLLEEDPDKAQELIDGVLAREPDNPLAQIRRSGLALFRADTQTALTAALTAAELAPQDARAQMQVGIVHRARIRERRLRHKPVEDALFQQALAAFDRAIALPAESREQGALQLRARLERALVLASWPGHEEPATQAFRQAAEAASQAGQQVAPILSLTLQHARRTKDRELQRWALERLVEVEPQARVAWRRLAALADPPGAERSPTLERMIRVRPQDAEAQVLYARDLAARRSIAAAVAHLEKVADGVDAPAVVLEALVELRLAQKDRPGAERAMERLRRDAAGSAATALAEAHLAWADRKLEAAAAAAQRAVERGAGVPARQLLARVQLRQGRPGEALATVDQALSKAESDAPVVVPLLRLRARLLLATGSPLQAARVYERVRRRRGGRLNLDDIPFYARALYAAGEADRARQVLETALSVAEPKAAAVALFARREGGKRPDRARTLLREAILREPDHPQLLREITRLELRSGRLASAEERLRKAIERHPERAQPHGLLARVLLSKGEEEQALQEARTAMQRAPGAGGPARLVVALLERMGRRDEAIALLEGQAKQGQLAPATQLLLARLHVQLGHDARAQELLEGVLARRADLPGAKNDLAFLLARRGEDLDRALRLAQEARQAAPRDAALADTLGYVYLRKGLPKAALPQLEEALGLAKDGGLVWASSQYHKGLALRDLGKAAEARKAIEQALGVAGFPEAREARAALEALEAGPGPV